ncbi:MAG TPA: DUF3597 domain-containing protein [Bosea sp. (in: a-proteobacteria)]|jgi:hypothetical protein|uniref:DUF3597 domain-containing protein n=1 Tax=Bosea sp. (in: a-proteobacteria) TaxID=1871050 RepID=UPI002E131D20|nr:DUF3597 domain-containing protein [Bosea sp. (in: a-proteobacteria)]
MGIFDSIKKAIFGEAKAATMAPAGTAASVSPGAAPAGATIAEATAATAAAAPAPAVDVGPILDAAVKASGQQLKWKTSIVDLLKALKIDSSLAARKELAHELGYTGDTNDSAAMNIWLHKAVIKKLAENGGKVPADLLD